MNSNILYFRIVLKYHDEKTKDKLYMLPSPEDATFSAICLTGMEVVLSKKIIRGIFGTPSSLPTKPLEQLTAQQSHLADSSRGLLCWSSPLSRLPLTKAHEFGDAIYVSLEHVEILGEAILFGYHISKAGNLPRRPERKCLPSEGLVNPEQIREAASWRQFAAASLTSMKNDLPKKNNCIILRLLSRQQGLWKNQSDAVDVLSSEWVDALASEREAMSLKAIHVDHLHSEKKLCWYWSDSGHVLLLVSLPGAIRELCWCCSDSGLVLLLVYLFGAMRITLLSEAHKVVDGFVVHKAIFFGNHNAKTGNILRWAECERLLSKGQNIIGQRVAASALSAFQPLYLATNHVSLKIYNSGHGRSFVSTENKDGGCILSRLTFGWSGLWILKRWMVHTTMTAFFMNTTWEYSNKIFVGWNPEPTSFVSTSVVKPCSSEPSMLKSNTPICGPPFHETPIWSPSASSTDRSDLLLPLVLLLLSLLQLYWCKAFHLFDPSTGHAEARR